MKNRKKYKRSKLWELKLTFCGLNVTCVVSVFSTETLEQHSERDTGKNLKCKAEPGRQAEFVTVGRDGSHTAVVKWFLSYWDRTSSK